MPDLYLIAHRVRGKPAFDVAIRMCCPSCAVDPRNDDTGPGCAECDSLGYWWIIPTSGHRAYPYNWAYYDMDSLLPIEHRAMPSDLPDHYPNAAAPAPSARPLAERLGLTAPTPAPIIRRI